MRKGKENLVSIGEQTTEKQREITQKGGIASGESKRKRKALKETMNFLLSMPISDKRKLSKAAKFGFNAEDLDNSVLVAIALFEKSISGDVGAIKELRNLIDESGSENGQLEALLRGLINDDV